MATCPKCGSKIKRRSKQEIKYWCRRHGPVLKADEYKEMSEQPEKPRECHGGGTDTMVLLF